jgi:glyceraldehyde 3-phosphate dehydrogenase
MALRQNERDRRHQRRRLYAKIHAHLFKYDTVHCTWQGEVGQTENSLIIDGRKTRVTGEKDPTKLPWKELGATVVIEATGVFTAKRDAAKGKAGYDDHITAGARKVILSAPAKDTIDATVVLGVNDDPGAGTHLRQQWKAHELPAPIVKVLAETPDVRRNITNDDDGTCLHQ